MFLVLESTNLQYLQHSGLKATGLHLTGAQVQSSGKCSTCGWGRGAHLRLLRLPLRLWDLSRFHLRKDQGNLVTLWGPFSDVRAVWAGSMLSGILQPDIPPDSGCLGWTPSPSFTASSILGRHLTHSAPLLPLSVKWKHDSTYLIGRLWGLKFRCGRVWWKVEKLCHPLLLLCAQNRSLSHSWLCSYGSGLLPQLQMGHGYLFPGLLHSKVLKAVSRMRDKDKKAKTSDSLW